jgi:hypothetical protein
MGPRCDGMGLEEVGEAKKVQGWNRDLSLASAACVVACELKEKRGCAGVLQVLAAERRADSSIGWWRIGSYLFRLFELKDAERGAEMWKKLHSVAEGQRGGSHAMKSASASASASSSFIISHPSIIIYCLLLGCSTCRVMKCHQHQDYQERQSSANPLRAWQLLRPLVCCTTLTMVP